MPYDLTLIACNNKYNSSYLPLIKKIKQRFPEFENKYYELEFWQEIFNSYTKQEILYKG